MPSRREHLREKARSRLNLKINSLYKAQPFIIRRKAAELLLEFPLQFPRRREEDTRAQIGLQARAPPDLSQKSLSVIFPARPRHFYRARISAAFHRAAELIKYLSPLSVGGRAGWRNYSLPGWRASDCSPTRASSSVYTASFYVIIRMIEREAQPRGKLGFPPLHS